MGARPNHRRTAGIFLVLALLFAGAATVVLFLFFRSLETRVAQQTVLRQQELVDIVVTARTVEQGITLRPDHLQTLRVPRMFFLDTMVSSPDAVVGRVPRERIRTGEPLRTERLADPKAGAGLNALIPKGQRALQVELRGAAAVGGFVSPGDYIDILFTGDAKNQTRSQFSGMTPGKHTTTLLQSKLVLGVDDLLAAEDEGTASENIQPSVTLALTPEEAQLVTHAFETGKVTLTLRNHVDVTRQEVQGVKPDSFIGAARARKSIAEVKVAAPPPARPTGPRPTPVPVDDPAKTVIVEGDKVRTVTEPTPGSK